MVDAVRCAVASSEHPVPAHAVAECAGALLETSTGRPHTILCVVGPSFGGALADITAALGELLGASTTAGIQSDGVLMGARVARGSPSIAVLALCEPTPVAHVYDLGALGSATLAVSGDAARNPPVGGGSPSGEGHTDDGRRKVRLVLAEPRSMTEASRGDPDPAIPLRGVDGDHGVDRAGCAPVLGGYVSGDPSSGFRAVIDGVEHRRGALVADLTVRADGVHLVHGTAPISHDVVVTDMDQGRVVSLDGLPAGEYLESLVLAADPVLLEGVVGIGFTISGDPRLVAARPFGAGLVTSVPLQPGQVVRPSVAAASVARRELAAAVSSCGSDVALLLVDPTLPIGMSSSGWIEELRACSAGLLGALAGGLLCYDPTTPGGPDPGALVLHL